AGQVSSGLASQSHGRSSAPTSKNVDKDSGAPRASWPTCRGVSGPARSSIAAGISASCGLPPRLLPALGCVVTCPRACPSSPSVSAFSAIHLPEAVSLYENAGSRQPTSTAYPRRSYSARQVVCALLCGIELAVVHVHHSASPAAPLGLLCAICCERETQQRTSHVVTNQSWKFLVAAQAGYSEVHRRVIRVNKAGYPGRTDRLSGSAGRGWISGSSGRYPGPAVQLHRAPDPGCPPSYEASMADRLSEVKPEAQSVLDLYCDEQPARGLCDAWRPQNTEASATIGASSHGIIQLVTAPSPSIFSEVGLSIGTVKKMKLKIRRRRCSACPAAESGPVRSSSAPASPESMLFKACRCSPGCSQAVLFVNAAGGDWGTGCPRAAPQLMPADCGPGNTATSGSRDDVDVAFRKAYAISVVCALLCASPSTFVLAIVHSALACRVFLLLRAAPLQAPSSRQAGHLFGSARIFRVQQAGYPGQQAGIRVNRPGIGSQAGIRVSRPVSQKRRYQFADCPPPNIQLLPLRCSHRREVPSCLRSLSSPSGSAARTRISAPWRCFCGCSLALLEVLAIVMRSGYAIRGTGLWCGAVLPAVWRPRRLRRHRPPPAAPALPAAPTGRRCGPSSVTTAAATAEAATLAENRRLYERTRMRNAGAGLSGGVLPGRGQDGRGVPVAAAAPLRSSSACSASTGGSSLNGGCWRPQPGGRHGGLASRRLLVPANPAARPLERPPYSPVATRWSRRRRRAPYSEVADEKMRKLQMTTEGDAEQQQDAEGSDDEEMLDDEAEEEPQEPGAAYLPNSGDPQPGPDEE
uniref:G_PROTEIN_RECEP_F1_2 domain-containing protein n=1 Tax=Macrostomum lignano TaxID=282301 RepID=A0A1I8FMX7_9PLAT